MARIRSIHIDIIAAQAKSAQHDVRYIYLIGETGSISPIKIGRAREPHWRLSDIQAGNYRRLELRGVWLVEGRDYAVSLERKIHMALSERRIALEWFDVTAQQACKIIEEIGERL